MNSFKAQGNAECCQAVGNYADQSKQYLIAPETMTGTLVESDRSTDISSNETTFQRGCIGLQTELVPARSP